MKHIQPQLGVVRNASSLPGFCCESTSIQHRCEDEVQQLDPSMRRRKRVQHIFLKPFKIGSAAKRSTFGTRILCCLPFVSNEMQEGVFVRQHIVDGRIVHGQKNKQKVAYCSDRLEAGNADVKDVCQNDFERSGSIESATSSDTSKSEECSSSYNLHLEDDLRFTESGSEQCLGDGLVSKVRSVDFRHDIPSQPGVVEHNPNIRTHLRLPKGSSLFLQNSDANEESERRNISVSGIENSSKQGEDEEVSHACEREPLPLDKSPEEDRNEADITMIRQTGENFSEMVFPSPFLNDDVEEELSECCNPPYPLVHSPIAESYQDSDHSSLAGRSSDNDEWDEEVIVFSRSGRLSSPIREGGG